MARVRLAAGRTRLPREGQALCFFAGANSFSYGDKLLTAENPAADIDVALLRELGLNVETRHVAGSKPKAPNSKLQHPKKLQTSSYKS